MKCMLCDKKIEPNAYFFPIDDDKSLCMNCALEGWRHYEIVTSDDMYHDGNYDDRWEECLGPIVERQKCIVCNEKINEDEDMVILLDKKRAVHFWCSKAKPKFDVGGSIFKSYEAFAFNKEQASYEGFDYEPPVYKEDK